MRHFRLLLLLLAFIAPHATAQNSSATDASVGAETTTKITLGQSIVALTGPWKFHIGDNPQWSDPSFDDSQWETVDLTPKTGASDPIMGLSNYVPGRSGRSAQQQEGLCICDGPATACFSPGRGPHARRLQNT